MKKLFSALLLGLVMLSSSLMAQGIHVIARNSYQQSVVSFEAPQLRFSSTTVGSETYTTLTFEGANPAAVVGRPNLPQLSKVIEIPLCSNVEVSVSNVQTKVLDPLKNRLMPVQPAPSKSDKGPRPFVIDESYYASEGADAPLAWVESMGVARDRNLAVLRVSPISYNPSTGELSQVTSMTITLTFKGADAVATRQLQARYYSPDFSLSGQVLSCVPASKEVRTAAPIHYLIVAHSSFRGQLDSFISWKKRQGFLVTVGYTDDANVGTSNTAIANYTKSFYDNATAELPAPTYLLIVGDHQQIPAFNSRCTSPSSDHVTDLYFATWTSGDNVPDCYLGRFSATSASELTPQIEKTLYYEGYNFANDDYLARAVLIAGEDGGYSSDNAYAYADPAMDYIAKTYINADNGYTQVTYYKNNTTFAPTGVTVTGSCSSSGTAGALRSLYNTGIGWVNYSAHGYDDSWSIPSFSITNVASMTNNNMPSIMIGNCCLSGKFNTTSYATCLGEALLRKGNNAGAVAYFGGTNSTYWPHDFCWSVGVRTGINNTMNTSYDANNLGMYDRLFHTHAEPQSAWHTTTGSMTTAGNMAVQAYGSYALYYWEIYELFGDPSLMPWLAKASDLTVDAPSVLPLGSATYDVHTQPYAYVALTAGDEHEFVAAAYADASGDASLALPSDLAPGDYELAVWAQNYRPYFQDVLVTVLDGPYVSAVGLQPNSTVAADSTVTFDITVTNLGNAVATYGIITLQSDSRRAIVINPEAGFNTLAPGDTLTLSAQFPTNFAHDIVDGTTIRFTTSIDFGGDNPGVRNFNITVGAPKLEVEDYSIDGGALVAGQNATVEVSVTNNGSVGLYNPRFYLVNDFGQFTYLGEDDRSASIAPGSTISLSMSVTPATDLPTATIPLYLYCEADGSTYFVDTLYFRHGSSNFEDCETGDFSSFEWNPGTTNSWIATTSSRHAGAYAFRSAQNLSDRNESLLTLSWTSSMDDSISFWYRVSSESGYDFFHFYIDGGDALVEASGTQDWTRAAFFVPAGQHTFTFEYAKDYSTSRGEDAAFIDDITLPFAGDVCTYLIDTVCQGTEYTFAGQVVNTSDAGIQTLVDGFNYLALNVMPAPQVSIETVNYGRAALLIAHGADWYVWSTGDTTDRIAIRTDRDGSYSVTGYRGNCSDEYTYGQVSISQVDQQANIALYPNPAHDQVVLSSSDIIRSAQLVNLMGQTIMSINGNSNTLRIDLSRVSAGVYFVRVQSGSLTQVQKVIKK